MLHFYERYQQGFYQDVYNDLLAIKEQVFEEPFSQDALLVAQAMMKRVRYNVEVLIPRLKTVGYKFVDAYWNENWLRHHSLEEQTRVNNMFRIFQPKHSEASHQINMFEQAVGTLPLSLRAWYEEVGGINLIGSFPATKDREKVAEILDPLFIFSLDAIMENITTDPPEIKNEKIEIDLAPDSDFKYGYSGSGAYVIQVPHRSFDGPFEMIHQAPMFVNYLRTCFQWGGFFGLSQATPPPLTSEELAFLTKDLLPF